MPPVIGKPPIHTHAGAGQGGAIPKANITSHGASEHSGALGVLMDHFLIGAYLPPASPGNISAQILSDDLLYAVPIWIGRTQTFDRIAIRVNGAGAGGTKARLGIYEDDGDAHPGALSLDAGTVDVDGTGLKAITISKQLTRGLYWLACVSDGTPDIFTTSYSLPWPLGTYSSLEKMNSHWEVSFTYAALPDPFTSGGSINHFGSLERHGINLRLLTTDD